MSSKPDEPSDRLHRREMRFDPPPCPKCALIHTHVATRTEYFLYVRCRECGHVWSVAKPGAEPMSN